MEHWHWNSQIVFVMCLYSHESILCYSHSVNVLTETVLRQHLSIKPHVHRQLPFLMSQEAYWSRSDQCIFTIISKWPWATVAMAASHYVFSGFLWVLVTVLVLIFCDLLYGRTASGRNDFPVVSRQIMPPRSIESHSRIYGRGGKQWCCY